MGKQKSHWHKAFISSLKTSIIVFTQDIFHTVTLPLPHDSWDRRWMVGYLWYDVSTSSLLYDDGEAERGTCCITDCAQQQTTSKEESTQVQNSHYLLPACVSKEETKPKQVPWTGCRLVMHEDAAERKAQKRLRMGGKRVLSYTHTQVSLSGRIYPSVRRRLHRCEFG